MFSFTKYKSYFSEFLKIWHTVKYLHLRQIYFRIYYQIVPLKIKNFHQLSLRLWIKNWHAPLRVSAQTIFSNNRVSFLGEEECIDNPHSWNSFNKSKLWLYNLHYFDELNTQHGQNTDLLLPWINKWIAENPPTFGNGWEPYPLSLRLVNWIKWFSCRRELLTPQILYSLIQQVQVLAKRIEHHILANHIFVNGKALVFCGSFFSGEKAENYLHNGLKILDREIAEQFLADGGHFELSPMYHAHLLWDLCDLVALSQCVNIKELNVRKDYWKNIIIKAYQWLDSMCHPDRYISFFNDATLNLAPHLNELRNFIEHLNLNLPEVNRSNFSLTQLSNSGYAIVNLPDQGKAIIDIGHIGPSYQPGHAHADTLSFELSLCGQRILVNSGTSCYGQGEERQWERGTKAHNTVCIEDKNSSVVWGGFRVAQRAFPLEIVMEEGDNYIKISAAHNGYKRLKGKNVHRRSWSFSPHRLLIIDEITGKFTKAEAFFYFHPEVMLQTLSDAAIMFNNYGIINIKGSKNIHILSSFWRPAFGKLIKNQCLKILFAGSKLETEINWSK